MSTMRLSRNEFSYEFDSAELSCAMRRRPERDITIVSHVDLVVVFEEIQLWLMSLYVSERLIERRTRPLVPIL